MIAAQSTNQWISTFLGKATAGNLTAFVVPGMEVARTYQIDLQKIGLMVTDIPKHANVLVLIGNVPKNMRQNASVLYNQMPNPKAIIAIGTHEFAPLPSPDAISDFTMQSLGQAVHNLRQQFSTKSFERKTDVILKRQTSKKDHDMQGMNDGMKDMGFMSMVMMTENLPKSADGLPMEWGEAHFGPLFAGLPGGLEVTFLMDGDSIAHAHILTDSVKRNLNKKWLGSTHEFLATFSVIDPHAPNTYRILGELAIENALDSSVDNAIKQERSRILAKELVKSHLNWLISYASLLHFTSIMHTAEKYKADMQVSQTAQDFELIQKGMKQLSSRIENHWLLKKRLVGIGRLVNDTNDAWTRFIARVGEINQSLVVLTETATVEVVEPNLSRLRETSGKGQATLITPRGKATLRITLQKGTITDVFFTSPSVAKVASIEPLVQNTEVADALIAIASLDISPWEVAL